MEPTPANAEGLSLGWCDWCLNVRDLATSRDFYGKLGFRVIGGNEDAGYLLMCNGDVRIGLYQGHISCNMMNFRGGDIRAIFNTLQQRGVQLDSAAVEEESDGSLGILLKDPDGNVIYFNSSPGETR